MQIFDIIFLNNIFIYICIMDAKDFLKSEKLINTAELARKMWPDNKYAKQKLVNKLNEVANKTGNQRLTEDDKKDVKRILKELSDRIDSID